MKTVYAFIIILLGLSLEIKCQVTVSDNLNPDKADFKALLVKGNMFQFEFDTLYYVNKRFIKSQDSVKILRALAIDCLEKRKKSNLIIKEDIDDLTNNMALGFKMVEDSLILNQNRLDKLMKKNADLISINSQITIELNEAKEQIRKEKWNSNGNKMLYGVGGVFIGVSLGSLIILAAK